MTRLNVINVAISADKIMHRIIIVPVRLSFSTGGISVGTGDGVSGEDGTGVSVGVGVRVLVGTGVAVGVGVFVGTGVAVGVGVSVGTGVGVSVGTGVAVGIGVSVEIGVLVGVGDCICVVRLEAASLIALISAPRRLSITSLLPKSAPISVLYKPKIALL